MEARVDGGWGVDALLGEQTRSHADLDIVIQQKHVPALTRLLEEQAFGDVPRDDPSASNFVMGDHRGLEVDVHAVTIDSEEDGVYSSPVKEEGKYHPAASLTGLGRISGPEVKCISAERQARFPSGYAPHDGDQHDVLALCNRFGIELPEAFR